MSCKITHYYVSAQTKTTHLAHISSSVQRFANWQLAKEQSAHTIKDVRAPIAFHDGGCTLTAADLESACLHIQGKQTTCPFNTTHSRLYAAVIDRRICLTACYASSQIRLTSFMSGMCQSIKVTFSPLNSHVFTV